MTLPNKLDRLIQILRERSFERRRVILASGKESDFFIDCKQTILTAEGHALVGELMSRHWISCPRVRPLVGLSLAAVRSRARFPS